MSKIEIVGPKGLLQGVLASLQESSVFQIEPTEAGFIESGAEEHIRSCTLVPGVFRQVFPWMDI